MDLNKKKVELLDKARKFIKKNNIEDPGDRLAQKCASEALEFITGKRKS